MRLVSISLSDECKKPTRCSFCYLKKLNRIFSPNAIFSSLSKIQKEYGIIENICIEYNGYNIEILNLLKQKFSNISITTAPFLVGELFISHLHNIKAVGLSYDSEKICTPNEWSNAAKHIKNHNIKISCNYLIESIPMNIPNEILKYANQLNLLSRKPTGQLSDSHLKLLELQIEYYKSKIPIALDNCLAFQLSYIEECKRGKEFLHISPDGTIEDCCFKDKCYLYQDSIGE